MRIEFGVLGELCACADGRPIDLGPARQRCVLAVLLAEANRPVPLDRLADRVWGEERPQREAGTLHTYLSRLRSRLPFADGGIERTPGGYVLRVDDDAVDLHRFRTLLARARTAGDREAAALYEQALALWRGEPFADLETPWLESYRQLLRGERLAAQLDHNDVLLRLGEHAALLPPLTGLATEYPLDERIAGQLILALYRDGHQADALLRYERFRVRLADELGADPGAELQLLHRQILNADPALAEPPAEPEPPAALPVPRQLPAAPPTFTGRAAGLAELDAAVFAPGGGRVAVIGGPGGVGKTWLALHWAYLDLSRFPDGQLYVNLRGFGPSGAPMAPEAAIRGFLGALGVEPSAVPAGLDAQVALFRSLVADKKLLVVLDNARDTEQVAPLLPGGPGCAALVTSRNRLSGLVTGHGARLVTLDAFDSRTALRALARVLGEERVQAEPDAAAELRDRCAGLPLALGIVAARAHLRPGFALADLAAELREEGLPLDALDAGEQSASLRTVFSWSYRTLGPPARRLFRLLGVHPGPDITLPAAAGLAGLPPAEVKRSLAELTGAYLVSEHHPGRYTLHDLLRAYAAERADADDGPEDRAAAVRRMFDHCLHTAHTANTLLNRVNPPLRLAPPDPGAHPEPILDDPHALAWFEAEYQVLLAVTDLAAAPPPDPAAWQIPWALASFLNRRGRWRDMIATQTTALAAAERLGDPEGQAHTHHYLGRACVLLARYDEAATHLTTALTTYDALGDAANQARVHGELGRAFELQGRYEPALEHAERGLALFRAAGHRAGQANALNAVGWYRSQLGDHEQAIVNCEQALEMLRALGDRHSEAATWDSIGYAHHHLGRHAEAIACYENALAIRKEAVNHYDEALILVHLGDAQAAAGDREAARDTWQRALVISEEIRHPVTEELRGKLAGLCTAPAVRRFTAGSASGNPLAGAGPRPLPDRTGSGRYPPPRRGIPRQTGRS